MDLAGDPPGGGGTNKNMPTNSLLKERSHSVSDDRNTAAVSKKRLRESPEKVKKAPKQLLLSSYWLSKPAAKNVSRNTNRLSSLDVDDDDDNEQPDHRAKQEKIPKPPPIYVANVENIIPLKAMN